MAQIGNQPYPYSRTPKPNLPYYDTEVIDETLAPATTVITYKLAGVTVATKTITVSGAITTISIV